MITKIYYFSGTGNSLYIARQLKKQIPNSDIEPIVKWLSADIIETDAEKIVLVFPVYALTIPIPVRKFLKKIKLTNVKYICAVATRLGLYFNDFQRIDRILSKQKVELSSHFLINMPNNDVKVKKYQPPTKTTINELAKRADSEICFVAEAIRGSRKYKQKDSNYLESLPYGDFRDTLIEMGVPKLMTFSEIIGGVNYFYATEKCNGCGICERVCLSSKISIVQSVPIWSKKKLCYMCYACINFCPKRAIEIESIPGVKSYSTNNGRYSHPYASIQDIENQKNNK